jgi:hypothetical protein
MIFARAGLLMGACLHHDSVAHHVADPSRRCVTLSPWLKMRPVTSTAREQIAGWATAPGGKPMSRRILLSMALVACLAGRAESAPAAAFSPPARRCQVEVVRPDRGERGARFMAWLRAHPEQAPDSQSFRELLAGPAGAEVLIADIDNDGKDEYVVTTAEGSGGFLGLWVYRPAGHGWTTMEVPEELHHATHEFVDPLSHEATGLVRFCGSTYVALAGGDGPEVWRDAYLWKGGAAQRVCGAAWLEEQRRFFRQLFDHKLFDEAYGFLNGAQASCQPPPDPQLWLWMQSDLALTAHRMGIDRSCLAHIAAAQGSAAATNASPALRKALATNGKLCSGAAARSAARYDFSWLRALAKDSDRQFVFDRRFNRLLSAAVPDLELEDGELFRDVLKARMILPEGIELHGDRYVVMAGCMPHNCGEKGYIWVDLLERRSIVAVDAVFYDAAAAEGSRLRHVVALGSNTIEASEAPRQFWQQLGERLPDSPIHYAGPRGTWQEVEVPGRRGVSARQ